MKNIILIALAGWLISVDVATAQGVYGFTPNAAVPDADANGVALTGNVSGLAGTITGLTVSLNVANGYNGDLYAWLVGPNGGYAVLLNRVGVNNASATGYANSGLNIEFGSGANNVHNYQDYGPVFNGPGQLTGTWAPDGRNIDPASAPSLFGSTAPSAFLTSFDGTDPNGTWVLFVADFSNGGVSTVSQWGLNISTNMPEPSVLALLGAGALVLAMTARKGRQTKE